MKNIEIENEFFLDDIACRIVETKNTFKDVIEVDGDVVGYGDDTLELFNMLTEYLNRISSIRKVIPFPSFEQLGPNVIEKGIYINEEIFVSELKNKEELKEELNNAMKKIVSEENEIVTDFLINFARKHYLIKEIEEDTIEKIVDSLINSPEIGIIGGKSLEKLITSNELYEDNSDIIDKGNICFLDEVRNYIIQIDFSKALFEIQFMTDVYNSEVSLIHFFDMRLCDYIFLQSKNYEFLSVIKI